MKKYIAPKSRKVVLAGELMQIVTGSCSQTESNSFNTNLFDITEMELN